LSKTIRIDDDVEAHLAKNAKPFESPNEVLRRLFKLDPKQVDKKKIKG